MTERELKIIFSSNLCDLLEKRGMDRCDLLEYFPKEKKNGEVYHYTKEDIKRMKAKGNSIEKNNELGKIKRWANGSSMPDYVDLLKLCEVLECDTDYLLRNHAPVSKDDATVSEYMGLSEYTIENMRKYLDEQKRVIDKLVCSNWTDYALGASYTGTKDCLFIILCSICSTITERKHDEGLFTPYIFDGKCKFLPYSDATTSTLARFDTIDKFTKILDGLLDFDEDATTTQPTKFNYFSDFPSSSDEDE